MLKKKIICLCARQTAWFCLKMVYFVLFGFDFFQQVNEAIHGVFFFSVGVDWTAANRVGPSIASMSIGGGRSQSLNMAVQGLHNSGVAVSVAAGNYNSNACDFSPASEPLV